MIIENNNIYLGDCLSLMPYMKDNSIDVIFADLPYGTTNCSWDTIIPLNDYMLVDVGKKTKPMYEGDYILYNSLNNGETANYWKDKFKSEKEIGLWSNYKRIIKENGVILLYAQTPFDKILGNSNKEMLRYEWIWEKSQATGHLNAKRMPMKSHENILVFYKKLPKYTPQKTSGHVRKVSSAKNRSACIERRNDTDNIYNNEYPDRVNDYDSTERYPRSVIKFASDKQKSSLHKTQKPLALTEYMLKTYGFEGCNVLDNVSGSGTVGEACINLNMNYILMEKDEDNYNISLKRISGIL